MNNELQGHFPDELSENIEETTDMTRKTKTNTSLRIFRLFREPQICSYVKFIIIIAFTDLFIVYSDTIFRRLCIVEDRNNSESIIGRTAQRGDLDPFNDTILTRGCRV